VPHYIFANSQLITNTADAAHKNIQHNVRYFIEPLDTLTTHVTRQHAQQTRQALDNFKNLKDYKWLHLIPSIGYDTRWNTPVVSVSSSQFINYYQRKDDKKYRMIQLEQQADTDLEKTLFNLKGLYNRLLKQLDELETRHQIMNINRQLFEIEEQKHKNIEIDTEDFLKSQRSYLSQLSDYQNFKLSIHQTISEIENITKRTLLLQAPLL